MGNNSRTKNTLINTMVGVTEQLITIVLGFILRSAFIHYLGVQYAGVSGVFSSILTMLSLSELGFGTAIATALYVPLHEENSKRIQQLLWFYKTAYRYVACFIAVVGVCLVPFLDRIITDVPDISEDIRIVYLLYIAKTAASYLLIYKTTILKADQKLYIVKTIEIVCQIIRYTIEIIILFITKNFLAYLLIDLFATIIQNYIVSRKAQSARPQAFEKPENKLDKKEVRSLLNNIRGVSVFKISGSIGNSIDSILISAILGTGNVGYLANYTLLREQISRILKQFYNAITPSIGNLVAENKMDRQHSVFCNVFYMSFVACNFCCVCLYVLSSPFIRMWLGTEFIMADKIAFVIAFDFFLYVLLQAVASFRTANSLFIQGQYRPLITSVCNVILSVLLIRKLGIFGTILATIISRLITQWYDPYLLFRLVFHKGFGRFYLVYLGYILIFIVSMCVTNFIYNLLANDSNLLSLLIGLIVCIIVPNALVFLFTFKTDGFQYLIKTFKRFFLAPRKRVSQ